MTKEQEVALKQELLDLGKEEVEEEQKLYEAYGLAYLQKGNHGRDRWLPPGLRAELKELMHRGILKHKAILEKYKD